MSLALSHIAFYKFVALPDVAEMANAQRSLCAALGLKGTVLLAPEGINVMLAGRDASLKEYLNSLQSDARFLGLAVKWTQTHHEPFQFMLVKVKKQILAFDHVDLDPARQTGRHLAPEALKRWLDEKQGDVVLLDVRNEYEIKYGAFENALNPGLKHFRHFPRAMEEKLSGLKDRKIVAYCTGGIRCEKATALLLKSGFKDVYQLHGGILEYFKQAGGAHYAGGCFVFDNRVLLTSKLEQDPRVLCEKCGSVLPYDGKNQSLQACALCQTGPSAICLL